jgi:type IV pilus assembly protein PilW
MQIDYGVDNTPAAPNGDGVADLYTDCSAATPASTCVTVVTGTQPLWPNVVSVKINLLARNNEPTKGWKDTKTYNLGLDGVVGPFNDTYKRHAYTQLVRLVNPAGRRELP